MNDLRRESSGYLSGIDNSTTDPQGTVEGRLRRQLAYFQGYADRRDAEIERLQAEVGRLGKYVTRALAAHERGDPVWARELLIECVLTKDDDQKATQGPCVPGQERSGKSPERVVKKGGPYDHLGAKFRR